MNTTTGHNPTATSESTAFALTGAHVVPIEGEPFDGTIVVTEGQITALGPEVEIPADHERIDLNGRWVTPGLIDAHVHLGTHEEGEGWAGEDTNEMTNPVTAGVRALDGINPAEKGFDDALAGGVTTVNVNPGSANPIGGLAVAMKTYGRLVDEMVVRSPAGVKAALGENPKRVYGEQKKTPQTRMGTAYVIRQAFNDARAAEAKADGSAESNLVHRSLLQVLNREIPWRQHCHRADDIATALRMAEEFGYRLVLDHGTESWKIADVVAAHKVPVLYGPVIVSRSKVEVRDRTAAAPGILTRAGVEVSIITDHPVVPIDFLMTQVALAVREGLDPVEALRCVTINPARVLGVEERVGSLEVGKDADLVVWEGDPLDVRNRVLNTYIDGREVYRWDSDSRTAYIPERF